MGGFDVGSDRTIGAPLRENLLQPGDVTLKKDRDTLADAWGQDSELGRHGRGETALFLPQAMQIKPGIGFDAGKAVLAGGRDLLQRPVVAFAIGGDERKAEVLLGRKVIMDARLAQADGRGKIGIAEARPAALSHQHLGFRQQFFARICKRHIIAYLPIGRAVKYFRNAVRNRLTGAELPTRR